MKKILPLMLFLTLISNAQVGVGTTTPAGALDINSSTNGLLLPRVSLTALNIAAPVVNPAGGALVVGTLIWNTATAGVIPNNVVPGMYYWEGTRWISLAGSPGGLDWSLSGNTGTNPATNYVGTTDNVPLILRANSIERIRMGTAETVINEDAQNYDFRVEGTGETEMFFVDASTNHVHIRASSPFPTIDMFTSVGVAGDYPINGYATGQSSAGVYGRHSTDATGTDSNAGGAFDGSGNGFTNLPGFNIGVIGTAVDVGVVGTVTTPTSNTQTRYGGYFSNTNTADNVQATAQLAGYDNTNSMYYGGYFDGGQDGVGGFITGAGGDINGDANTTDYAWVGLQHAGTNYKIMGGGSVSTIVKDENNKGRILYASESPEITFTDSGIGTLVNGVCKIDIDKVLAKNIFVNEKHPLKVFIQLEGDCNGVFVTDKSANGFTVKELQNGKSNVSFSWQLIANRADTISKEGHIISKHVDVRLPLAPLKPKKLEQGKSKTNKEKK
ncbi:hypothetical protein G6N05_08760 [Flavobacterium sp. F372]|uniref:T9SS C-terminal target domain-containing protein n=1 Tax=Flavobacterium bernardetii TaxID=2813823 RepID=A0ABR7IXQ0_9FLAO|nr:hypothetical protein [Flavobacterium bernardetii]MBC5834550.1 hypothetical protein [Flavobacterium bernardetii]NHF70198.1 hypothetical protein [Flavobacterium bernardetii]